MNVKTKQTFCCIFSRQVCLYNFCNMTSLLVQFILYDKFAFTTFSIWQLYPYNFDNTACLLFLIESDFLNSLFVRGLIENDLLQSALFPTV